MKVVSSDFKLAQLLPKLWLLRRGGDYEQSMRVFREILLSLDIYVWRDTKKLESVLIREDVTALERMELLTFVASVFTREGNVLSSKATLHEIEMQYGREQSDLCYQLQFQKALNFLVEGSFVNALKHFEMSVELSANALEFCNAKINRLVCLDSLGCCEIAALDEFEEEISQYQSENWFQEVYASLESIRTLLWFRNGCDLDKIFKAPLVEIQSRYHRDWIAQLPYLELSGLPINTNYLYLTSNLTNYQTQYLFETLTGNSSKLETLPRLFNLADRFYLWTWKWIESPTFANAMRVAKVLGSMTKIEEFTQLGHADLMQFENALRWIGLFAGLRQDFIESVCARLQTTFGQTTCKFLAFEKNWIIALGQGNAIAIDQQYPKQFLLPQLANAVANQEEISSKMNSFVRSLISIQKVAEKTSGLVIDQLKSQVRSEDHGILLENDAAVRLLSYVIASGVDSLRMDEVGVLVFGPHKVQLDISDDNRIAKLFSLIHTTLGQYIRIKKKNDVVAFAYNRSDFAINLLNVHALQANLCLKDQLLALFAKQPVEAKMQITSSREDYMTLDRKAFENVFQVSASSARRLLRVLEERKLVVVQGNSKNTTYDIKADLYQKILSGKINREQLLEGTL